MRRLPLATLALFSLPPAAHPQSTLGANVTSEGWPAWWNGSEADVSSDGSRVLLGCIADLTPSAPTAFAQAYL